MDPKLKFSLISTAIALLSYYGFRYLHALLNKIILSNNPDYQDKYPWIFTRKSHVYVFLVMLLKLSIIIALIWLEFIAIPEFLQD